MLQIVTIGIGYPKERNISMKKKLITTLLVLASSICLKSDASMVIMDYQGNTVAHPSGIERNLLINSDDGLDYDIALRPLDNGLKNSDGSVVIPLDYFYINNAREDVYFRYNQYSNLLYGADMNGVSRSLIAKIRGYGMVPAGVYTLNLEIQATDHDTQNIVSMSTFMLEFVVPPTQEISFHGEEAAINVSTKDVFARNKKIASENNPMVTINSNTDWSLFINTEKFGDAAGDYYIRTVSASPAVYERLQERIQLYPNKEILIAKGKAPSNNEYVSIELAVEGKDGKIMKAGNYNNILRFILREDRR